MNDFKNLSDANCLNLNPAKCQALQVKFGKDTPRHSDLRIGNEVLPYVEKAKVLGVLIQHDLKWNAQIDDMLSKANKRLFMLRSLKKFGFDQDELTVVYKSYLRPVLEYGDVVWHPSITKKQSKDY